MINLGFVHFVSRKEEVTLKLKQESGPIIVNTRHAFNIVLKC